MIFNQDTFRHALLKQQLRPVQTLTPLICIDKKKYKALHERYSNQKLYPINLTGIRERANDDYFNNIHGSLWLSLRYSKQYFPAYQFIVNELINEEWLAAVDWHKFHRDHIVHQVFTYFIGKHLLTGMMSIDGHDYSLKFGGKSIIEHITSALIDGEELSYIREYLFRLCNSALQTKRIEKLIEKDEQRFWENIIRETQFISFLYHDIGYPWQFARNIANNINVNQQNHDTEITSSWMQKEFGNRLLFYPFNGYKKRSIGEPTSWQQRLNELINIAVGKSHGIHSAIVFLYLNDIIKEFPPTNNMPERQLCLEWAAMIIMMHDIKHLYRKKGNKNIDDEIINPHLRINFHQDPLSALLVLSDLIQEFSRPYAIFNRQNNNNSISFEFKCNCIGAELKYNEEEGIMTIAYIYDNRGACKEKEQFITSEQETYFNENKGLVDFSSIGIKRIELQAIYREQGNLGG